MVPLASIVSIGIALVVCFGVPIGGLLLLRRRYPRVGRAFACGILAFFASQLVTRIPLMTLVVPRLPEALHGFLLSVPVASFTAGLFEETGRLVVMVLLMKAFHRLADGLAFGLGHGGLEAMVLVGLTMVNNLVIAVAINTGSWASIAKTLPAAQATLIERAITTTSWYLFLVAGVERVGAIGLHVTLSLIVLAGVVHGRRALAWLAAVLLHGTVNLAVVSATQGGINPVAVEVAFLVVVAILVWTAVRRLGSGLPDTPGATTVEAGNLKSQPSG